MKARRLVTLIFAALLCLVALVEWYTRLSPWIDLKRLELQTKRNLDAAELQRWAMNLMAQHPGELTSWNQYYGTNYYHSTDFPSGLRKISLFNEGLKVLSGNSSVALFGMVGKGGPFIKVGSPSLAPPTNQTFIQWKPGIYFVGD